MDTSTFNGEYEYLENLFNSLAKAGKITESEKNEQLSTLDSVYYKELAIQGAEASLTLGISFWVGRTQGEILADAFREARKPVDLPEVEEDILRALGVTIEQAKEEDKTGILPAAKEQAQEMAQTTVTTVVEFPWKETVLGALLGTGAAFVAPVVVPGAASIALASVPLVGTGVGGFFGYVAGKATKGLSYFM